ncbi:MAG TPA: C4-dicarboxylate ABC transporter, partial [Halomonas sp.]|nr:C4-dicarboxylate ABC transporter [Halomonas sp.]
FYLKGVAPPGVEIVDLYKAVVPFVAIIILACILMSIFPSLITGLPSMMVGY